MARMWRREKRLHPLESLILTLGRGPPARARGLVRSRERASGRRILRVNRYIYPSSHLSANIAGHEAWFRSYTKLGSPHIADIGGVHERCIARQVSVSGSS